VKRPLQDYAAIALLIGLGVSRLWTTTGTASSFRAVQFIQPALMLSGAVWMGIHPKSARWVVGAYFAAGAIKQVIVFPSFAGSTLDLIRRPFSMSIAAWLAWTLWVGRKTRVDVTGSESSNHPSQPMQVRLTKMLGEKP
jgi:hypothetical protein